MLKNPTSKLLSHPFLFNKIRSIVAGSQKNTKFFVKHALIGYNARTVLDVGCGTGEFVEGIPNGVRYLGIDINQKYINFAMKYYQNNQIKFLLQDVTHKSFYSRKSFDAVIFISMLHHLSDDELSQMLPIIKKITKKVVIVADLIPDPPGILRKLMVKLDQGKFIRPKKEKVRILREHFKVVKIEIILSRLAVQCGIICEV